MHFLYSVSFEAWMSRSSTTLWNYSWADEAGKAAVAFKREEASHSTLLSNGVKMIAIIQTTTGGASLTLNDDPYHFMAKPATVFSCFLCIRKPSHDMTDWNAVNAVGCALPHIDPKLNQNFENWIKIRIFHLDVVSYFNFLFTLWTPSNLELVVFRSDSWFSLSYLHSERILYTNTGTLTLSYRSKGYDKSRYCSLISTSS